VFKFEVGKPFWNIIQYILVENSLNTIEMGKIYFGLPFPPIPGSSSEKEANLAGPFYWN